LNLGAQFGAADDPVERHAEVGEGSPMSDTSSKELIEWADANKMKRALEILAKNSAREERMQSAPLEPALPRTPTDVTPGQEI